MGRVDPLAAILGMALATYSTRAGGIWLMSRVAPSARVEAWLRQVPGAVLISIIAPAALATGPAGLLAVLATVLVATRTRNLLLRGPGGEASAARVQGSSSAGRARRSARNASSSSSVSTSKPTGPR